MDESLLIARRAPTESAPPPAAAALARVDAPSRAQLPIGALAGGFLPAAGLVLGALVLRLVLFPIQTGDLTGYLQPWWDEIKAHGVSAALRGTYSNYAPAYLYLLVLLTHLPVSALVGIKAMSVFFDGVLAAAFVGVVSTRVTTRFGRLLALALPLFAPTVVLNGAAWAQCDVIHTAFALLGLRAALKNRWFAAAALTGVGFAFKLQTVFFLPALVLMLVNARVRPKVWASLLLVPLVHLVSLVPAWLAGRPARDLVSIYLHQANNYTELTMWAPSIYQWLPGAPEGPLRSAGLVMTGTLLCAAAYLARHSHEPWGTRERILTAVGTTMLCPFLLPSMHERYFFTADVLSLLLPFWFPRQWWIPLAITAGSVFSYGHYLFGQNPFEMKFVAVFMAVALAGVTRDWVRMLGLSLRPLSRFVE